VNGSIASTASVSKDPRDAICLCDSYVSKETQKLMHYPLKLSVSIGYEQFQKLVRKKQGVSRSLRRATYKLRKVHNS